MYEVRFTILNPKSEIRNPKSQIANMALSASGAGRGSTAAAAAGTALRAGVVSTASRGHTKHGKYFADVVALAGWAK